MQNQMNYAFNSEQNDSACSAACLRNRVSVLTAIMCLMAVLISSAAALSGVVAVSVVIVLGVLLLGVIIIIRNNKMAEDRTN